MPEQSPTLMGNYSLRVEIGGFEVEATAEDPKTVRSLIDDAVEKFLWDKTMYHKKKLA